MIAIDPVEGTAVRQFNGIKVGTIRLMTDKVDGEVAGGTWPIVAVHRSDS